MTTDQILDELTAVTADLASIVQRQREFIDRLGNNERITDPKPPNGDVRASTDP